MTARSRHLSALCSHHVKEASRHLDAFVSGSVLAVDFWRFIVVESRTKTRQGCLGANFSASGVVLNTIEGGVNDCTAFNHGAISRSTLVGGELKHGKKCCDEFSARDMV